MVEWEQERPMWCPHQDCVFARQSQGLLCGGRLPKPEPHDGDENTHRICIKTDEVLDLQVNTTDLGYFRWVFDALDGKATSWLSSEEVPGECHRCGGTGREPDWRGLGLRARREREHQCISLRQMAKRIGVSAPYLSDLERANRPWLGPKARAYMKLLGLATPTTGEGETDG